MGERWRECSKCPEISCECGYAGDIGHYIADQNRYEIEREMMSQRNGTLMFGFTVPLASSQRMESEFNQGTHSAALEAAVLAVQKTMKRDMSSLTMNGEVIPFHKGRKSMSQLAAQAVLASGGGAIAVSQTHAVVPYFPSDNDWKLMLSWGDTAIKSGLLPSAIKTREAAAIIALKGRELGIPYMVAVAHIHVINGKPCMSAEMMQALARRNLPGLVITILESTNEKAELEIIRPEKGAKPFKISFTIEDAKRALLLGKAVWTQYPRAMLWSRAVSAGLRQVCPEALMGISYTPEELGAEVNEQGDVLETTSREHDVIDQEGIRKLAPKPTTAQIGHLFAEAKKANVSHEQLKVLLMEKFGFESTKELTLDQYHEICDILTLEAEARVAAAVK